MITRADELESSNNHHCDRSHLTISNLNRRYKFDEIERINLESPSCQKGHPYHCEFTLKGPNKQLPMLYFAQKNKLFGAKGIRVGVSNLRATFFLLISVS